MPIRFVKWPTVVLTITGSTSSPISNVIRREIKPQPWIFCYIYWIMSLLTPWLTKLSLVRHVLGKPACDTSMIPISYFVSTSDDGDWFWSLIGISCYGTFVKKLINFKDLVNFKWRHYETINTSKLDFRSLSPRRTLFQQMISFVP